MICSDCGHEIKREVGARWETFHNIAETTHRHVDPPCPEREAEPGEPRPPLTGCIMCRRASMLNDLHRHSCPVLVEWRSKRHVS